MAYQKSGIVILHFLLRNMQDTVMPFSFPCLCRIVWCFYLSREKKIPVYGCSQKMGFCVNQTVIYIQSTIENGALSLLPVDFFCLLCCWKEAGHCHLCLRLIRLEMLNVLNSMNAVQILLLLASFSVWRFMGEKKEEYPFKPLLLLQFSLLYSDPSFQSQ